MTSADAYALDLRARDLLRRSGELVALASDPERLRAAVAERARVELGGARVVGIQYASANSKLAPVREVIARSGRVRFVPTGPFVTSTYVSIAATCPSSCPFRSGGCYAIAGASHLTMRRLDAAARGWPALWVSRAEASEIDRLWRAGIPQDGAKGGRDLRLHVGGDVSCNEGARALGRSADRWASRGGGRTWSFTARWAEIPRASWGPASVLASVQSPAQAEAAIALGYVPAIAVQRFTSRQAFPILPGVRAVPCPSEASGGKTTCSACRLCLDDGALRRKGLAIAFAIHGQDAELALPHAHAIDRVHLPIASPTP
jgi:hypothetical protein